jgi:putative membrane protein
VPYFLIVAIALAAITALFAIQNATVVAVSFLGWEWQASLALILILTLGVGILVGYLASLPSSMKKGSQLRQARKRIQQLESRIVEQDTALTTGESGTEYEDELNR